MTNVPIGATTGTIVVTSPTGSATSSTPFNVTAAGSGAPSITGFAPAAGTAGTAVTITGANFDANGGNDKVTLNATHVPVSSATATSINVSVPAATSSGPISVATQFGKAVSSSDFIVPPFPYTAASIESVTRMAIGETRTITVTTPNKIALVLFDGSQGQRVSLLGTDNALSTGAILIYNPDGTVLNSTGAILGGSPFLDTKTLPLTGAYTVLIDPESTVTGSITLTLYNVPDDISGPIVMGGSSLTMTIATPGQNGALSFSANAGQQASVIATNYTIPSCIISIKKPDGSVLGGTVTSWLDRTTLPVTGTYTLFIDPQSGNTGSVTLRLNDCSDVIGTIIPGGPPVSLSLPAPGQQGRLIFTGTGGQSVSLSGGSSTLTNGAIYIYSPDGTVLTSGTLGGPFLDAKTLPATATYTVLIDPESTLTGDIAVTLYEVSDVTGSITPGGSPLNVTLTVPGQNAQLTFSGTAGQKVSLVMSNWTIAVCTTAINNPDGSELGSTALSYIDAKTLPVTGTYTVFIDPAWSNTGSVTASLYDASDFTSTVTIGGSAVNFTSVAPGKNASLTFSGTSGQQVTVRITGNTIPGVAVTLLKPDGSSLTTTSSSAGSFNLATQTLPTTVTYTIVVDPSGTNTGSINVSVTSP